MYIPSYYKQDDHEILYQYMRQFPFGVLVTAENDVPWATHIPFVTEKEGSDLVIWSHISAANPQSQSLKGKEALAIFREPHAYISPTHYERKENVPTWNYVAVHAYGIPELITGKEELILLQEKMIGMLEPAYMEQWKQLPDRYRDGLLEGITGFRMKVTRLFGKEKLSQNKTHHEQETISASLMSSEESAVKQTGKLMKDKLKRNIE